MGRHFLHEHLEHATSWSMSEMLEILNVGRIHLVLGPMCHCRMAPTDDRIEQVFVRGKTQMEKSSSKLATLLARENVNRIPPDTGIHEQMATQKTNGYVKVCTTTSTPSTTVRPLWTIT